ncbi:predicted protein [Naegleria gruberi]|uniref:Predicted protein n=1 Tax=Naegleria gruberi TaxID=5762 RepID=D2VWL8_NAEGR|nr:uncharacterized protein NAEGRDRAFT_73425 [Naegleria gruberi]EFC38718.1 predicted protein [Naegleria gruberi]|eukprot:XP_002671462.1 predicted protein [Naegleria gruberi strain NEG-M]
MKRPQSSGGSTRRQAIPAQSSTTTNNTTTSSNMRGNRSTTPQQHPLLISSSSSTLGSSSDLSIKGIGNNNVNTKVNSSEERLRLEAKNLITKWTTREQQDNLQIKDNLILNTSLNMSSNNLSSSSIKRTTSSIRNENPLLKSTNPITTKSIIESTLSDDQVSANQLLNTPLMDKIKDKRPSELTRWEKLRLSMERKKNVVVLNVLEPTFESKIQLVKNDLNSSDNQQHQLNHDESM